MRLYLARHAEAVPESEDVPSDELRHLSPAGRADALVTGGTLAASGDVPHYVFTSPLVRAVQTAELLQRGLGSDLLVASHPQLGPGGRLGSLLDSLLTLPENASVLLVGHEPMMSGWTAQLLGRPFTRPFRPGTVVRLDFDAHPEPGQGRVGLHVSRGRLEPLDAE